MTGTKFVVDFGDVQLPKEMADQLDRDIRQLVSHTVAGLDFHGDDKLQFVIPKDIRGYRVLLSKDVIGRYIDKKVPTIPGKNIDIKRPGG